MIDDMANTISEWIGQMRPGGYVYSASRMGKSWCVFFHLRALLNERMKFEIPLVIWSRPDSLPSEANLWNALLRAAGFEFVNPEKPMRGSQARYVFQTHMASLARCGKHNFVVLLIDEAQGVSFKEWKWLVGLQNALDHEGIKLCVISIGTQQMGYQHELMAVSGNAHVTARFFAVHTRFHGIRSLEELVYLLNGYDVESEWPAGSGCSYLQYFAADDFARGERLSSVADNLWRALFALIPDRGKGKAEFPMQHVCDAIENALFKLALGATWEEATRYESWIDALSKSGYAYHMRIIQGS